ncbi:MAG: type I-B CRISPR-associated endonuclease Cas1b [Oscillospiraceae bacterium]|nr:type I-B CRISPR-associated endonuclease Cas1b [Oscillospiraceae bacterium]
MASRQETMSEQQNENNLERRNTKTYLHDWESSSLQKIDGEYHLIADGILTRKDYNLLFENPEKKMHLPVESTECLNLHSNIAFSSSFFSFAAKNNLKINMFSKYGEYEGAFVPAGLPASSSLVMKQALAYNDTSERLMFARQFALAAAHNIRENLKYYTRYDSGGRLSNAIEEIAAIMHMEKTIVSVSELMLLEGRIRGIYYMCLNDIFMNDDFLFVKRTKRPPEDPLNALISFGNVVLYRRIAKELYKSRLDIRFGFLHATNRRHESLNLDIAEIFRPVIVDRIIFTLINKHMISAKMNFEKLEGNAVYLNSEGKRIFITEFDKKMAQRLKYKSGIVSYEGLIRAEIQKLTRYFDTGEPYKPYKYFL